MKLRIQSSLTKIVLITVFIILLPALSYTIFQINRVNTNEALLKDIYERQLNVILFSINQYCWDVVSEWSSDIRHLLKQNRFKKLEKEQIQSKLRIALRDNSALEAVMLFNPESGLIVVRNESRDDGDGNALLPQEQIQSTINQEERKINPLFNQADIGYYKVEPLYLFKESPEISRMLMVFAIEAPFPGSRDTWLGGIIVDTEFLGKEILGRKFRELDSDDFIFGVRNSRTGNLLFTSPPGAAEAFEQEKPLWLFPDLKLLLRMKGTSIAEIARKRTRTNLLFLIGLDIILLGGLFLVLKAILGEIYLAKMKSDFVSNVSHELRTPLALIRMFSEMLELDRVQNEQKKMEYYRIISNESARLTQMINNILDFSHIEAGQKAFNMKPAHLSTIIENVLKSYRFHLERKGFSITTNIAESLPAIRIDKEAISQAFINLLDNAVKYSDKTKSITIQLHQMENTQVLTVKDEGIGIEKSQQKKIFEKFYRASDSLVPDTKGSGLGLTLVKYIMDYHGGKIALDSAKGKGCAISLIFSLSENIG
ncbi:HAMP domain-containing histidine kinase [candidate division KSB1 bacterium]|nr:HAMP domain-containing histidine kinase [candidate division KSB1 bacterium]